MTSRPRPNPPTFGQQLRRHREQRGLIRAELALRVGVSKAAVQQWENDTTLPGFDRVPLIQDALDLAPGELDEWVRNSPKHLATLRSLIGDIPGYVNRLTCTLRVRSGTASHPRYGLAASL